MAKGFALLLFCLETCAQPTRNGLKSGFFGIGHSSPTLEVAGLTPVERTTCGGAGRAPHFCGVRLLLRPG
jgi:hypothetical protein